MKLLMQEASSVLKAVEKAWIAAGKPREFTIKIYEESEHNFIGLTTKPAKIGIMFGHEIEQKEPREVKVREKRPVQLEEKVIERKERPEKKAPEKRERETEQRAKRTHTIWTEPMIQFVQTWLQGAMDVLQRDVSFTIEPQNYYLRCVFEKPILETPEQERILFRTFSLLILQALKRELHRPLRGFKIVLLTKT